MSIRCWCNKGLYFSRKVSSRFPAFETVTDSSGRVRRRAIFTDGLEDEDGNEDDESDADDSMTDEEESEEEISHEMEPPKKKSKVCKKKNGEGCMLAQPGQ